MLNQIALANSLVDRSHLSSQNAVHYRSYEIEVQKIKGGYKVDQPSLIIKTKKLIKDILSKIDLKLSKTKELLWMENRYQRTEMTDLDAYHHLTLV